MVFMVEGTGFVTFGGFDVCDCPFCPGKIERKAEVDSCEA